MKKSNNSKSMIIGLLAAMVVLITIFVVANLIESSDFQFGRDTEATESNNGIDESDTETDEPETETDEPNDETAGDETEPNDIEYDDGTLFYIGNAEMYEILNDRSGTGFFVYIGRPTCPHCREFEPVLRETLRYLDGEMRYFEIDLARETDAESEMTMLEILNELGVPGVPSTVFIVDGEVVDRLDGREREDIISFFEANGGLN